MYSRQMSFESRVRSDARIRILYQRRSPLLLHVAAAHPLLLYHVILTNTPDMCTCSQPLIEYLGRLWSASHANPIRLNSRFSPGHT